MIKSTKYKQKKRITLLLLFTALLNSCADDSHHDYYDNNDKIYKTFDTYKENKLMTKNRARYQKEKELLDEDKLYNSREVKARRSHFKRNSFCM